MGPDLDVVIVGDGPGGLALAAACRRTGLAVTVLGSGRPWSATYGMWRDEVPDLPDACFAHVSSAAIVHGHRRHVLERPYAVVDNDRLRAHLADDVDVRVALASRVEHFRWGSRVIADGGDVDARHVVDATGRPPLLARTSEPAATQSALGVVVDRPPPGFDAGAPTIMDLRPLPGDGPPTFCYVVAVHGGWLVEETVLAARSPVAAGVLADRLAARVGAGVVAASSRTESVAIAMGGRLPGRRSPVLAFGAAAGLTHPATGFSVAASLRAAPRVAAALSDPGARPSAVWDAVWPRPLRLTRRLHDYGLQVLLGLGPGELATFFDAFFDLPVDQWSPYLRVDATPGEVSAAMTAVLRRLPGPMRRRLFVNPFGGR